MWKLIPGGVVRNESDTDIAVLCDNISPREAEIIKYAPEAISQIKSFVDEINSGSFKKRAAVKKFETFLSKIPV